MRIAQIKIKGSIYAHRTLDPHLVEMQGFRPTIFIDEGTPLGGGRRIVQRRSVCILQLFGQSTPPLTNTLNDFLPDLLLTSDLYRR
jgi:hypothetical protein